jgi:hypothetical protein
VPQTLARFRVHSAAEEMETQYFTVPVWSAPGAPAYDSGLVGTGITEPAAPCTGTIHGTVTVDGAPTAGVPVRLTTRGSAFVRKTVTAGDGSYHLVAPPGVYLLRFGSQASPHGILWYGGARGFAGASPLTLVANHEHRVDIELTGAAVLTGSVRDGGGAPLAGFVVRTHDASTGSFLMRTFTGADGRFRLALVPGDVKVLVYDPTDPARAAWYTASRSVAGATVVPLPSTGADIEMVL